MLRILMGAAAIFAAYHFRAILSDWFYRRALCHTGWRSLGLMLVCVALELFYVPIAAVAFALACQRGAEILPLPRAVVEAVLMLVLAYLFLHYDPARNGEDDIDPFGFEEGTPHAHHDSESATSEARARRAPAADHDA